MKNTIIILLLIGLVLIISLNLFAQQNPLNLDEIKNGLRNYAEDPQKDCNSSVQNMSDCIINPSCQL